MVDAVETTDRRLWWRHLISFLIAPVTMTVVIPLSITTSTGVRAPDLTSPARIGLAIIGGLLIIIGLGLFVWTNTLFDRTGKGTLGIGELLGEPVHLVVRGPYRHGRNPMITGVVCILLAEAAITAATPLFFRAVAFSQCWRCLSRLGHVEADAEDHEREQYKVHCPMRLGVDGIE